MAMCLRRGLNTPPPRPSHLPPLVRGRREISAPSPSLPHPLPLHPLQVNQANEGLHCTVPSEPVSWKSPICWCKYQATWGHMGDQIEEPLVHLV